MLYYSILYHTTVYHIISCQIISHRIICHIALGDGLIGMPRYSILHFIMLRLHHYYYYQLRSISFRSKMLSFKQKPEQLLASTEPALSSLSSQSPIAARTGRVLRKRTGSPPLVSIFGTYTRRSLLLTFTARARKQKMVIKLSQDDKRHQGNTTTLFNENQRKTVFVV